MIFASATSSLARLAHFLANHWEVVVLIVGLLAALSVALAKGVKYGFRVLVAVAFVMLGAVVARAVLSFMHGGVTELIRFGVAWGPTVLFSLFVGVGTLVGVWRGLRKSLILAIHAVCVGVLCITLFFVLSRSRAVDAALLKIVNKFFEAFHRVRNP